MYSKSSVPRERRYVSRKGQVIRKSSYIEPPKQPINQSDIDNLGKYLTQNPKPYWWPQYTILPFKFSIDCYPTETLWANQIAKQVYQNAGLLLGPNFSYVDYSRYYIVLNPHLCYFHQNQNGHVATGRFVSNACPSMLTNPQTSEWTYYEFGVDTSGYIAPAYDITPCRIKSLQNDEITIVVNSPSIWRYYTVDATHPIAVENTLKLKMGGDDYFRKSITCKSFDIGTQWDQARTRYTIYLQGVLLITGDPNNLVTLIDDN